jgi:ubiquinone/menaquinone biosynthesis C-methylase UbiE
MKVSESIWNLIAPIYDRLRRNPISGYFLKRENWAVESLTKELSPYNVNTVCDLGVGRGHSLSLIPEKITHKIAIDRSLLMLKLTRKESPDSLFINADVLHIPVKNAIVDLILCIGLVEYISDLESLLSQINGILKKEGHLLLSYSPKNILTFLRFLRGHKIYPRKWKEIERCLSKYPFDLLEFKTTPLQHQCLLKKKK